MRWVLLVIAVAGCVGKHVPRARVTPKTWVGQHVDRITAAWGYADETQTAPNGNSVLVFAKPRARAPEAALDGVSMSTSVTNSGRRQRECVTYVEVNAERIVVNVDFKGADC